MQMQQVRVGRAAQVPVPPANTAPLEISREIRQQMRIMRHCAFERYQENAQWTKELLEGSKMQDDVMETRNDRTVSAEELKVKNKALQEKEGQLVQLKEAQETTQRRFKEILSMLTMADDTAAVKYCEQKLTSEKMLLLPRKPRKMEIVRL